MRDYVNEHFKKHKRVDRKYSVVPPIVCSDGVEYSVQASSLHYCNPREDHANAYSSVEVWGPFTREPEGWVSIRLINRRIRDHGGVAEENSENSPQV